MAEFAYARPQGAAKLNENSICNEILLALPSNERSLVFSKLTLVDMELETKLQEAGERIEFCYFPSMGMVSILTLMADGKGIEVGLAGKEGFVGMQLTAGFKTSSNRAVVQATGRAYRMSAEAFLAVLKQSPELNRLLNRNSQKVAFQTSQIAACNRLHDIDERLARWLLMTQDRIETEVLPLTHEFLSQMLGSNRSTVSLSAAKLQEAGLIEYRRGKICVRNRQGLEDASCECYDTMKQQLATWDAENR